VNATELVHAAATAAPRAAAIIDGPAGHERTTLFGEVDRRARCLSALFAREGLAPGQGVLVLVPMSAELYVVMAGLLHAGLVAVFLDPGADREHLERCLEMFPVDALVVSPRAWLLRLLRPSLRRIAKVFATGSGLPGTVPLAPGRVEMTLRRCSPSPAGVRGDRKARCAATGSSSRRTARSGRICRAGRAAWIS
jgi:acyl-CoA synthetase (AMP-forming)/AMP-acid ligase II